MGAVGCVIESLGDAQWEGLRPGQLCKPQPQPGDPVGNMLSALWQKSLLQFTMTIAN